MILSDGEKAKTEGIFSPQRRCVPLPTLQALALGIACIDVPIDLYEYWTTGADPREMGLMIIQCALKVVAWCILVIHIVRRVLQTRQLLPPKYKTYSLSHWLQLAFCFVYTATAMLHSLQHAVWTSSEHPSGHGHHDHGRGPPDHPKLQVQLSALPAMLVPLLLGVVFWDALRELMWLLWALCLGSLMAVAVLTQSMAYALAVVYYILQSALIFFAIRQNARMLLLKKQEGAKEAAAAMGKHDLDMKHIMANAAHDLKTPLSSFMAGVQLLSELLDEALVKAQGGIGQVQSLQDTVLSAKQCVASITNTNHFMLMTINRCIDYTKTCSGLKLVPKFDSIHLLDTLSLPLKCMRDVQEKVSMVMLPLPSDLSANVITDKQWLQENLLCLLSNAVRYSTGGQVTVSVKVVDGSADHNASSAELDKTVSLTVSRKNPGLSLSRVLPTSESGISTTNSIVLKNEKALVVEVQDCGIGMTDAVMAQLFCPFKQTQRLAGGTGLGLFSLAKRMDALQGACGVRARDDGKQGSLFWFRFPYRPDDSELEGVTACVSDEPPWMLDRLRISPISFASPTPSSPASVSSVGDMESRLRVLLVDDSPSVVKMTKMLLIRHGCEVAVAENGAEALDIIKRRLECDGKVAFDVILMDLQMPVMDGLEAVKRLRSLEPAHSIHHMVFGLSANDDEETQQEVHRCGFDAFLSKPFKHRDFLQLLQSMPKV